MVGTKFAHYEITSHLGSGGMGDVYQATDSKLGRSVAIKILPAPFASDPESLSRFRREAQVLASLSHPNIAHIYGLEEFGDTRCIVMELVEGETLQARIKRGAIPVDEALTVAQQIADALEAAHEKGVIHRDLKPGNVMITGDGKVKVLDFGLAKAHETNSSSSTLSNSPTVASMAATNAGVILGTAAYMSPEQARGRTVDKRADIWAFGVVLYEMLTGERAFKGDDVSETLASVLKDTPSMDALPPATPPRLTRLMARCLDRDLKTRLRDIGEARIEIARIEAGAPDSVLTSIAAAPVAPGSRWPRVLPWAVAATLAALAVWMAMRAPQADRQVARVLVGIEPAERLLSDLRRDSSSGLGRPSRTAMAFSPDSRSLVFSAEHADGVQLYLRRLDQLNATAISGTEGASNPFFSPDGQWVGFYADGALKKVPVNGGPVVALCKVDLIYGATWGRTDQIVFANVRGGLWQVSAAGGTPMAVTKLQSESGELSHRLPQLLPDGQTVLFTVTKSGFPSWDDTLVVAQSLATGNRKVLIEGGADARFVPTGHLVYLRRATLMAVPFDPKRVAVTGPAVGLVADVMQAADIQPVQIDTGAGQFAVSQSGSLAYVTGGVFPQDRWSLVWVDRTTGRSEALHVAPGAYLAPRLSPDGRHVAFGSTSGDWDLWTYDVLRGIAARFPMAGDQSVPIWTPDGSRLTFMSQFTANAGLFWRNPDGSGPTERLTTMSGAWPHSWTPDGSALAFGYMGGISLLPRDGKSEPRPLVTNASDAAFSPDGRWLAYYSSSERAVYAQPYPALDRRERVSTGNGREPAWRQDGRELYYVEDTSGGGPLKIRVMAVPITTTPAFAAGTARMLFEGPFRIDGPFRGYDVTPDGQRFLMVQEVPHSPAHVSQMVLVQNWFEELKARVPAK